MRLVDSSPFERGGILPVRTGASRDILPAPQSESCRWERYPGVEGVWAELGEPCRNPRAGRPAVATARRPGTDICPLPRRRTTGGRRRSRTAVVDSGSTLRWLHCLIPATTRRSFPWPPTSPTPSPISTRSSRRSAAPSSGRTARSSTPSARSTTRAIDQRPLVIVRAADASDVVKTVRFAARQRPRARGPRRRPQHPRLQRHRGRRHARPLDDEGPPHRRRAAPRLGPARRHGRRVHGRGRGPRARDAVRRHRERRTRRADARWRHRLPRPQVRPDDRQPRLGRGRHRGRPDRDRERRRQPGPVLGDPRRRRQLRRRDPLPVPARAGRDDPERRAVPAADPRRPARPGARSPQRRPRSSRRSRSCIDDAAAAVRPRGAPLQAVGHRDVRPRQRRHRGRAGRARAVPPARDPARRGGVPDAVPGHLRVHRRGRQARPERRPLALPGRPRRRRRSTRSSPGWRPRARRWR